MTKQEWLIDEAVPPDAVAIEQTQREISSYKRGSRESLSQPQAVNLAVRLQDIMIWDD
jgi:hypothetical protein